MTDRPVVSKTILEELRASSEQMVQIMTTMAMAGFVKQDRAAEAAATLLQFSAQIRAMQNGDS